MLNNFPLKMLTVVYFGLEFVKRLDINPWGLNVSGA